ncbi:hypothetical protein [Streptomyces sp. MP131-18]|uniref:hypothetical protein n=1 Tax=Streptomyces sp. MP131-18 TaxID=1857892 RepID=UPI00097BF4D0|nr:hypothetical protein [Streptomyces sp. MP131-18]ONK16121.1 hypothetical protein STBA_69710 [Streptomyces sp. MP131-18]
MASAAERALGRLLSKHRTDHRRRGRIALRDLALGAAGAAAAGGMVSAGLPGPAAVPVLAAALLALWRGAARGHHHRRRGTEAFLVRERGLAHRRAGAVRTIPWQDIDAVTVRRGTALRRLLASDVTCTIRTARGEVLRVTSFTHEAQALARAVADRAGQQRPVTSVNAAGT